MVYQGMLGGCQRGINGEHFDGFLSALKDVSSMLKLRR